MAANPLVSQGTLNRLIGSVTWALAPELNVTAPFLGKEGIRLALDGESTIYIQNMTGATTSPEPYMMITLQLHLIKPQPLATLYKQRLETTSLLGDGLVKADTIFLPPFPVTNCAIANVRELNFAGDDASFVVSVKGYYIINQTMWNLVS